MQCNEDRFQTWIKLSLRKIHQGYLSPEKLIETGERKSTNSFRQEFVVWLDSCLVVKWSWRDHISFLWSITKLESELSFGRKGHKETKITFICKSKRCLMLHDTHYSIKLASVKMQHSFDWASVKIKLLRETKRRRNMILMNVPIATKNSVWKFVAASGKLWQEYPKRPISLNLPQFKSCCVGLLHFTTTRVFAAGFEWMLSINLYQELSKETRRMQTHFKTLNFKGASIMKLKWSYYLDKHFQVMSKVTL